MLYPTHIQCPVVLLRCFIRPKFSRTSHKPFSHALQKLSTVAEDNQTAYFGCLH